MYRNHPEVQGFLERGGTLVVPTRQRAAAIALAYNAAQLERGAATWDSPDVVHWSAWQGRRLDAARGPAAGSVRRLSAVEDWYLWHEALDEARTVHGLVQADSLVDDLQRADELIDAWGLAAGPSPGAEGALLTRLRRRIVARRDQLQIAARIGWRQGPEESPGDIWCLGFDEIGLADRRALEALGVRIDSVRTTDDQDDVPVNATRFVAAADPHAEAQQVAHWCRTHLQRDPRARLLVLMVRRSQYEEPLRTALTQRLDGDCVKQGAAVESLFALEGGLPLPQFPLVDAARSWLRAVCGRIEFSEYSALLRSPYLAAGGVEARTRLETWLRRQQVTALDPGELDRVVPRAMAALDADATQCLRTLQQLQSGREGRELPPVWAQRWVEWLASAGWPGTYPLGSREQQVRQRFEELLGEIAQLGDVAGRCSAAQALDWLDRWLRRASFEPASGDVPVTVSTDLRDPLVHYDGIWVCGLTAQDWPAAAVANPFLAHAGLHAAGSDAGTPGGALRRAEEAIRHWARSTGDLVCSWPMQEGDAMLLPSPLFPASAESAAGLQAPPSPWFSVAVARERYGTSATLPWPPGNIARGGVSVLEHQSSCPFQGFALGRLRSDRLETPRAGISAQVHGILLHDALQRIWRDLGDSAALRARQAAIPALVREAVAQALECAREQLVIRLPQAIWEVEGARCERLIHGLLAAELDREPFTVVATEESLILGAQGVGLRLKLDRLDRMEDGSHALIDYKSGKPRGFEALAQRPPAPQLLAYAAALNKPLCAVASAHLNVEGTGWRGAMDRDRRLRGIRPLALGDDGWQDLLQQWRAQVIGLLEEFAQGEARVAPQPRTCESCHLSALCRINETELALNEAAEDPAAEDGTAA